MGSIPEEFQIQKETQEREEYSLLVCSI